MNYDLNEVLQKDIYTELRFPKAHNGLKRNQLSHYTSGQYDQLLDIHLHIQLILAATTVELENWD